MEQFLLELAKIGGPPVVMAGLFAYVIWKIYQRGQETIEKITENVKKEVSSGMNNLRDTLEAGFADENKALRDLCKSFGELSALQLQRLTQEDADDGSGGD